MCDTGLHECHTENWVWLVLQAQASCSLFSNQPTGGKKNKAKTTQAKKPGHAAAAVGGIPPLESGLHGREPGCCSVPLWTLMPTKIAALLQSQVAALITSFI